MSASGPAPRAAVFDFDGTLFDATDAIVHSFNTALVRHGRPPLTRETILPIIGRPLFDMFPALEPDARGERVQGYIDAYREAFWPVCVRMTRPLPGLKICLDRLRAAGVRLAIATNRSERGARAILQGFGMTEAFQSIVALEHVKKVKPDPEAVQLACRDLGVTPGEAAMIGDTPDDMMAGRAAGARTVGVLTGVHSEATLRSAGANAVTPTLESLPDLLLNPV